MKSLFSRSSLPLIIPLSSSSPKSPFCLRFRIPHSITRKPHHSFRQYRRVQLKIPYFSSHAHQQTISTSLPSDEDALYVEELVEKDWSFLEPEGLNLTGEEAPNFDRIISAGEVGETSRVLVSMGSEGFVDRLVSSSPCELLLVAHESLLVLALIKEKYDKVKCWQGELVHVPEKWASLDVVFLYFLPAMASELDHNFAAIAQRCSPGARVIISHPHGRELLEQQRKQHPDIVISDLPDKMTVEQVAAEHSFTLTEYIDKPSFYLAVLKFAGAKN